MCDEPLLLMLKAADGAVSVNRIHSVWCKLRPDDFFFYETMGRLIATGQVIRNNNTLEVQTKTLSVLDALAKGPLAPDEIYELCSGTSFELRKETWELIDHGFARLTPDFKIEKTSAPPHTGPSPYDASIDRRPK